MAPKSQDDHQEDDATRRTGGAGSDEPAPPPDEPRSGRADDPVDFGAFVSRSVRSSADRFKQGQKPPQAPDEQTPATRKGSSQRRARSTSRERPARYWRDSVKGQGDEEATAGGTSQRFIGRPGAPEQSEPGDDGGGGGFGAWWQGLVGGGDDGGPNRSLIGYFLLGLILMLLAIIFLVRVLGGDEDPPEDAIETPVPTQIVAPGSGPDPTPEATQPPEGQETAAPTDTPEIRRGGDNQLDGDEDEAEGTPGARREDGDLALGLTPVAESPLAQECSDRCLIRVQSDDTTKLLEKTGNRPSFAGENMAWVVATPTQVSLLDEQAHVELVQDSAETLSLYVVTVPQGGDAALVNEYGAILDDAGSHRLVQFSEVPARVSTLADNGYNVTKVAPAPPRDPIADGTRPPLSGVSAGALMGQVSDTNVRGIISELQASGSNDGTGIGSRYYTIPGNQAAADYLYQQLESYGLRVWYEDFLTPEGILLVNVVAEAPGNDDGAVYAIMAHFDSINVESSSAEAPGADDNASGMAVTLEIARILAQYQLESPVRFVFVNAEEVGIIGSSVWAKQANANSVPIDGVFNVDSVGSDRQGRLIVLNSDASSAWLQDILISTNSAYGLGQHIESRQNPQIVADDNMVRNEGIDAVMIARELYGWSPLHHSARDVAENVSIDNVLSMTYLVLLSVVELAK